MPVFGPPFKAFLASLSTFPLGHHNLSPLLISLQQYFLSASLGLWWVGAVFIPLLEARLAAKPPAAHLGVTSLGRKGLHQHQPVVELHLLSSAGVTDVNIPTLPPRNSHSTWEAEHLEFQVSHLLCTFVLGRAVIGSIF